MPLPHENLWSLLSSFMPVVDRQQLAWPTQGKAQNMALPARHYNAIT
jgi:hypothetical protein